ncbi:hypothetical protein FDENT_11579 [Fusarium denticulatum]|uniref:Uncharacterized protein n=1 Tax=Fusarium denticulatum TaxID=48507 RepID=A0A8H5TDU4_9HYPO|nr:hypothetical protein FDENT_11579 [Fusarium denticulatum]
MAQNKLVHVGWKRVAWPELRIQRLETSRERLPSSIESLRADIRNHAYTLLRKYNLLYRDEDGDINEVLLEMRQQHLEPGTAQPTIIIIARWSSDKTVAFRNLAQEMVAWLAEWTSNVSHRINVEITAPENVQTIYYGAVGDRALSKAWDSTRKSIRTLLDSLQNTRGSLTCLALHKYGVNPDINANPPTVYISMDHCSDESGWHYVATCVKRLLDKQGWNHVQVHIEHNLNMFYTFRLLPTIDSKAARIKDGLENNKRITSEYSNVVHIGDDIGAARYVDVTNMKNLERDPGLGTLGCFVQIKTTNHQEWRTFILTNYHVARPAFEGFKLEMKGTKSVPAAPEKNTDLWYVDNNGYSPGNKHNLKGQVHGMESPSRTKHNFTITMLKDAIAGMEESLGHFQATNGQQNIRAITTLRSRITTLKAEMRRKIAFFEAGKQAVGKIFLCPGFLRKSNGRRMDWALISVDKSRAWSNSLPGVDDWIHMSEDAKPSHTYSVPIKDPSRSLEEPKDLGRVYKFGTVTKGTTGDYSHDQEDVMLRDDEHLDEAGRYQLRVYKRWHLWVYAVVGIIIQGGVLVYFGFVTQYRSLRFEKEGSPVEGYAVPLAITGSVLLMIGMLICSRVVESGSNEIVHEVTDASTERTTALAMVCLQKQRTVADQFFQSAVIYPETPRFQVCASTRAIGNDGKQADHATAGRHKPGRHGGEQEKTDEAADWLLKTLTSLGTFVSLLGIGGQFTGLRGMHWTA